MRVAFERGAKLISSASFFEQTQLPRLQSGQVYSKSRLLLRMEADRAHPRWNTKLNLQLYVYIMQASHFGLRAVQI